MTTPTLAERIRAEAANRSTWLAERLQNLACEAEALERELDELRTDRQHLCSELVELRARCAELRARCVTLSNAKLRHEGYEATCVERDEWKATVQAAQGALDRALAARKEGP